jgi:hypothetical protein
MSTVKYAIVVTKSPRRVAVEHIFHHFQDAARWLETYVDTNSVAVVEQLEPPLGLVRDREVWLLYKPGELRTYTTREQAEAASERDTILVEMPIRPAMPVQKGAPQFNTEP